MKIKDNQNKKDCIKSVNISPKRKTSIIRLKKNNLKIFLKSINTNDNKEILTENESPDDIDKENKESEQKEEILSENKNEKKPYDTTLLEEDEEFNNLNEYDKKYILGLMKEEDDLKNYEKFISRALSDKNFFEVIDNIDIEFNKEESQSKTNNVNIKSSKSIKNIKKISEINMGSEDNSISLGNPATYLNSKNIKRNYANKPMPILTNYKNIISRNNKIYKKLKKSHTLKNFILLKNNIPNDQPLQLVSHTTNNNNEKISSFEKKNNKNENKDKNQRFSFSIKKHKTVNNFLKTINEGKGISKDVKLIKKSSIFKNPINDLKKNNILKYKTAKIINNNLKNEKPSKKEESLNYLFKKITFEKDLDDKFINEYKNYFMKNKNISEHSLNKYINRKYEINDFVNFCTSLDKKIKEGNILSKWKKNYYRIGKIDNIKSLLKEEGKQDYFLRHLLQNYMNPKSTKRNYYDYEINDLDLIPD